MGAEGARKRHPEAGLSEGHVESRFPPFSLTRTKAVTGKATNPLIWVCYSVDVASGWGATGWLGGHATSQSRWRRQGKPEHAARWAWSHVSFQRIPREPERTWLLSQALDGCRAQFGRNIPAQGDSRC